MSSRNPISELLPDLIAGDVFSIDYQKLYDLGYRGLLFDIDNTLAPYEISVPDERLKAHLRSLPEAARRRRSTISSGSSPGQSARRSCRSCGSRR